MNILKMTATLWNEPTLQYVGRSRHGLGLGNPWGVASGRQSESTARHIRYWVTNNGEALYRYREWFLGKLVKNYTAGMGYVGLDEWERVYLSKIVVLSREIRQGKVHSLGCFCVNINNYQPVKEGLEECHAEILYKGCLLINEFESRKTS